MEKFENIHLNKKDIEKGIFLEAPEGWRTLHSLCTELLTNDNFVGKIVKKYRTSNPEYFVKYKIERGQAREHYSPELVNIINNEIKQFREVPVVPIGWKTITAISEEFDLNYATINKIAKKYIETIPEGLKWFKSKSGRVLEHYSPELIEIITHEIAGLPKAPTGWKTKQALSYDLSVSTDLVKRIINKYKKEGNTDYYKEYRDRNGGDIREHYSPEFIEIIKEEVKKFKEIPESSDGWLTNRSLSNELNIHKSTIKNIADKYRSEKPEHYKILKMKDKQITEHYSPELVEIIKNKVKEKFYEKNINISEAPEDWKTKEDLSTETGISIEDINRAAAKLRKEFPDKFGKFKDKE